MPLGIVWHKPPGLVHYEELFVGFYGFLVTTLLFVVCPASAKTNRWHLPLMEIADVFAEGLPKIVGRVILSPSENLRYLGNLGCSGSEHKIGAVGNRYVWHVVSLRRYRASLERWSYPTNE